LPGKWPVPGAFFFGYGSYPSILGLVTQPLVDESPTETLEAPPAVWAKGLVRRFGKTVAVDHVDLSVGPGEFYGLLGQNGAGKTTTIKTIVGLLRPNEGSVGVGEFDTWESPREVKARIGVLPEEFNLYERLTGAELLDFTAAMHGLSREEATRRRDELLDLLDLLDERPVRDHVLAPELVVRGSSKR